MYLKTHNCGCGCNHPSHKIKVDVPTKNTGTKNKYLKVSKNNPFAGDAD